MVGDGFSPTVKRHPRSSGARWICSETNPRTNPTEMLTHSMSQRRPGPAMSSTPAPIVTADGEQEVETGRPPAHSPLGFPLTLQSVT